MELNLNTRVLLIQLSWVSYFVARDAKYNQGILSVNVNTDGRISLKIGNNELLPENKGTELDNYVSAIAKTISSKDVSANSISWNINVPVLNKLMKPPRPGFEHIGCVVQTEQIMYDIAFKESANGRNIYVVITGCK